MLSLTIISRHNLWGYFSLLTMTSRFFYKNIILNFCQQLLAKLAQGNYCGVRIMFCLVDEIYIFQHVVPRKRKTARFFSLFCIQFRKHGNLLSMVALMIFAKQKFSSFLTNQIERKNSHVAAQYQTHTLNFRANQPPIVILLHVPQRSRPHWRFPNVNPRHVYTQTLMRWARKERNLFWRRARTGSLLYGSFIC